MQRKSFIGICTLFLVLCGVLAQPIDIKSQTPTIIGKIAYTNGGDIWKMDGDGSNRALVIDAGTSDTEPVWSPDGLKIAFKSNRAPSLNGGIWIVNADGSGLTLLTNTPDFGNANPTWSPDGTKIAFESNRDALISSIYIMNADSSNVIRLTNQFPFSDSNPAWSPDGARMVFETNQGLGSNIGIINLDGSGRAVIGAGQFPAWSSPDGSKIIYASIPPMQSNQQIFTMNPDGSGVTQITSGDFNDQNPSWKPDGQKIVFARNISGTIGLWTMNADGSNQVTFSGTNNIGNGYSDWQPFAFLNTPVGSNVIARNGVVLLMFANVSSGGTTTAVPIDPSSSETLPNGFASGADFPAYEISTTAVYTAPITVCLQVPAVTNSTIFNALAIFHNEGGTLSNRTVSRDFATKTICASVNSLSPFVVAQSVAPTAANVSVGGRVLQSNGAGISRALVSIVDQNGETRSVLTNTFGFYRFAQIPAGQTYTINARHKGYRFNSQIISVLEDIRDVDFTAKFFKEQ